MEHLEKNDDEKDDSGTEKENKSDKEVLEFEKIEKINTRRISYVWNSFEEWSVRIKGKNDQFKKKQSLLH